MEPGVTARDAARETLMVPAGAEGFVGDDGRPVPSRESAGLLGERRHPVVDAPGRRITALQAAGGAGR